MSTYQVHPAADLFPMMTGEEFAGLVADIKTNGQREPVVFWNGKLVDGRNRAKACEELGIEVDSCELDTETDPVRWVISHNLHRRHLSESQRAMVAAKLMAYYAAEAKERQKRKSADSVVENLPPQNGKARDKAGVALNVSGKTVDHATTVLREGSKDLIAAVERGEVSVSKAAKIAKTESKPCQLKAAKEKRPRKPAESGEEADPTDWHMAPQKIDAFWSLAGALMDLRPQVAKWAKMCPEGDAPDLAQLLHDLAEQVAAGNWSDSPPSDEQSFNTAVEARKLMHRVRGGIARWPERLQHEACHWVKETLKEYKAPEASS